MMTYDFCSLFTSNLLNKIIDTVVNSVIEKCPDYKIVRQQLDKLFEFTSSTDYHQVDRVRWAVI